MAITQIHTSNTQAVLIYTIIALFSTRTYFICGYGTGKRSSIIIKG